jgi:hypothetical protein
MIAPNSPEQPCSARRNSCPPGESSPNRSAADPRRLRSPAIVRSERETVSDAEMSQINLMAPCRVNNTAASTLHSPAHRVTDYTILAASKCSRMDARAISASSSASSSALFQPRTWYCTRRTSTPLPSRRRNERTNHSTRRLANCRGVRPGSALRLSARKYQHAAAVLAGNWHYSRTNFNTALGYPHEYRPIGSKPCRRRW